MRRFITFGAALAAFLFIASSVVAPARAPRKVDTKAAAAEAAIGRPDLVRILRGDGVCRTHVFPEDDDRWQVPVRVTGFGGVTRHTWIEVNDHSGIARLSRINVHEVPVLTGCEIARGQ